MNSKSRFYVLIGCALFFIFVSPILAGVDLPVPYMPQPDNKTCLPTSLAMVLHYKGKEELTKEVVFRLHKRTRYDRYNLPGILKDYDLYALPCWYELGWNADTLKNELDAGHPVITGCDINGTGHFVVITGYTDDGKWIINDPARAYPGYKLGGRHCITDWEPLSWRGGVFIHEKPFPKPRISAIVEKRDAPKLMRPGQMGEISFDIKNNGKQNLPQSLYLECTKFSFTETHPAPSSFYKSDSWLSPSRVMEVGAVLPGDTKSLVFKIKAPDVIKPTFFKEFWTLLDEKGRRISQEPVSGPGLFDMFARINVEPEKTWNLPMFEEFEKNKTSLDWCVKFGTLEPDTSTTMPRVMRLLTPGCENDVAWLGDSSWKDYKAEAMVYCEYRPELKPKGWDRIGIFVRDNGDHAGNFKSLIEAGNFYCMTFDSDDGRLRAGYMRDGAANDYLPKPYFYLKKTGWHKFAIRCQGDNIIYELDGKPLYNRETNRRDSGSCGVFYRTIFPDQSLSRGIRFANFKVLPSTSEPSIGKGEIPENHMANFLEDLKIPRIPELQGSLAKYSNTQVCKRAAILNIDVIEVYNSSIQFPSLYKDIASCMNNPSRKISFSKKKFSELNQFIKEKGGNRQIIIESSVLHADNPLVISTKDCHIDFQDARIEPGADLKGFCVYIRESENISLSGLSLADFPSGIYITKSENIRIRESRFERTRANPIVIVGPVENFIVKNNRFLESGSAGIIVDSDVNSGIIENNLFDSGRGFSNHEAGILLTDKGIYNADENIKFPEKIFHRLKPPQKIIILHNTIMNNLSSGIYCDGGVLNHIIENRIVGNSKEGVCLDSGSTGNIFYGNIVKSNGKRYLQTDRALEGDFVLGHGRLSDGCAAAKLPGISIDNALYNVVVSNTVQDNFGGGVKMVRTGINNLVAINTLINNNEGASEKFHFFGIEMGAAIADVPTGDLDFMASCGNIITGNIIMGSHYAGIFLGENSIQNQVYDNIINGATHWAIESVKEQENNVTDNLSDSKSRNVDQ